MSEDKENHKPKKEQNSIREFFDSVVVAFVIAIIIRTFFLGVYKIPSESMLETLQVGDHILVNKLSYLFTKPKHDDIVVFEYPVEPDKDYIKRVIGIPGDVIEIKDKYVYRNGEKLNPNYVVYQEPFNFTGIQNNIKKFTVPENMYFMLGDNRDNSLDSRFWGFVDEKDIVGRAFIIYWSWNNGIKLDRLFSLIR